ncbi:TIGR00341 family protein [Pseudoflavitalea rhizosphaerae]|uniref:TIGR00341 family protein n=1 Tax=Pseudoflavitalea rhizosphaerae TaxID=1884793 RepID=UPI000F8DE9B5|nr:TIGR00341 family protein [Pseudoflavitalea rhizosphaerae]
MAITIIERFKLLKEKESFQTVKEAISAGVVFRGTNLWILIFAIFIASLGLNVNSTAVIIGAMLISPLMGPIQGMGFSVAINDLQLLRKALRNYFFATAVSLTASTIYFLISPLNEAHSELLARTSPNIYDVLIALFGGLAGALAICSKHRGNVVVGVAIATALMPPLCTAGFGLATFNLKFFFGALYLFFINSVFIAWATLLAVRAMKFPSMHKEDPKAEARSLRIIWAIVILTLAPSIYFGYRVVQKARFVEQASRFIDKEGAIEGDYLLSKNIDADNNSITLVYGGKQIDQSQIQAIRSRLPYYNLEETDLQVKQGFAAISESDSKLRENVNAAISARQAEASALQLMLDSLATQNALNNQLYKELKAQYPQLTSAFLQPGQTLTDSSTTNTYMAVLRMKKVMPTADKQKLERWLQTRLNTNSISLVTEIVK